MIMGHLGALRVKIAQAISERVGNEKESRTFWIIFFVLGFALGDIAFAYSYSTIMRDFQMDPHRVARDHRRMQRATLVGIFTATFFYLFVGITGYLAFGNNIWLSKNILQCFKKSCRLVAIDAATACMSVLLIEAFQQVYPLPVNQFFERRFPNNKWLSNSAFLRLPGLETLELNLFSSWRFLYIVIVTIMSLSSPSLKFGLGIFQDIGFSAFIVYIPLTIYLQVYKIRKFSTKWIGLHILSFVAFLVFSAAIMGLIEGTYIDVRKVLLFKPQI